MKFERDYSNLLPSIKVDVFDVMEIYADNRHEFDNLCFPVQFGKLYDACEFFGWEEERLSRAVNICLTLEQHRMSSYSQGNTHIEDYHPENVRHWTEYMK